MMTRPFLDDFDPDPPLYEMPGWDLPGRASRRRRGKRAYVSRRSMLTGRVVKAN